MTSLIKGKRQISFYYQFYYHYHESSFSHAVGPTENFQDPLKECLADFILTAAGMKVEQLIYLFCYDCKEEMG